MEEQEHFENDGVKGEEAMFHIEWPLFRLHDGKVDVLDPNEEVWITLGPADAVQQRMCDLLAQNDFGERG